MKLYTYFRSSAAFRVRIALNMKGVLYEAVPVDLRRGREDHTRPEYLALNPQGLVPALDEGSAIVAQSIALLEYLEERFPSPPLLPEEPEDRSVVRSMALAIACDMHPLNNLRVLTYLRSQVGLAEDGVTAWYHHWVEAGFRGIEEQARRFSDGRHMFGNSVTFADICLVPQMYNAVRFKCDLTPFPTLRSVCGYLETLPEFIAAAPEAQPDARRAAPGLSL